MSALCHKRTSSVATNTTTAAENTLLFDLRNGAEISNPVLC
jgi:hypothetical protein